MLLSDDHKSDWDMLRSCSLPLVCGLAECIQLIRLTATVHLKADHMTLCLTVSVYLMYICYRLGWVYLAEYTHSNPLICNQCSPLYFSPI